MLWGAGNRLSGRLRESARFYVAVGGLDPLLARSAGAPHRSSQTHCGPWCFWRSRSTSAVRRPSASAATARLIASVVFPVPPFCEIDATVYISTTLCFEQLAVDFSRAGGSKPVQSIGNGLFRSDLAILSCLCAFVQGLAADKVPPPPEDGVIAGTSHAYHEKDRGGWVDLRK